MIVWIWILLIMIPLLIGSGIMSIVYGRKANSNICLADCFIVGLAGCVGVTEVAHVIGYFGKLTLHQTGRIYGILLLIGIILPLFFVIVCRLAHLSFKDCSINSGEKVPKGLPLTFLGLVLFQMLFVFCRKALVVPGDITLETVQSFLDTDGIYRVMPLTGETSEMGIPLRYAVLCLPTLYAILTQCFQLEAELVVCHVIPVVVLGGCYLVYYRLSESIFGRDRLKERYWFLLLVACIITFSDGAIFLDGYGAMHAGYLGTSIRNLILVPYTICAMLERRYWKALLCILAEMSLVWTFWGCGVCLAVAMGILILDLVDIKFPIIGKYLQIFRKEDEQG